MVLPAGKEISLEYNFRPARLLGGRDFQLALTVFYEDTKGSPFSTTFFNSTVDFTELEKIVDTEAIFLYLLFAGAVAAAGAHARLMPNPTFTPISMLTRCDLSPAPSYASMPMLTPLLLQPRMRRCHC